MVAQTNAPQHETAAQREDRMLHLAMLKNTTAEPVNGQVPNLYRVRSDSTPAGVYYLTDGNLCTCEWQRRHHDAPNEMCSHMAYVRFIETVA